MKSSLLQLIVSSKFELSGDEEGVSEREGSYKGIRPEALYNSVEDFERIFSSSFVSGHFVDLGCGTGLSCLLYGAKFPDREAIGVEFELSRIQKGQDFVRRNNLLNTHLIHGDLGQDQLPIGDTYFLYFPTGPVLDRMMSELYFMEHSFHLVVVESHGDLIPRIEKENWLTKVGEIDLHSPRHYPRAVVYKRNFLKRSDDLYPHTISFQKRYLVLEDHFGKWIGDSWGLQWIEKDEYDLLHPPRRISWKDVKEVIALESLSLDLQSLVRSREQGIFIKGEKIRKIYMTPEIGIELSSGEKIRNYL